MDAICNQVKQRLVLNSTSFIQMNDGARYSALCGDINKHQRPAPFTKSRNDQHFLFKWQTATRVAKNKETMWKKRWTTPFWIQSGKNIEPFAINQTHEKRQIHWLIHVHNWIGVQNEASTSDGLVSVERQDPQRLLNATLNSSFELCKRLQLLILISNNV